MNKYVLNPVQLHPQVYFVHDESRDEIKHLGESKIYFIGGKEGIGKKALAYEYAYENHDKYKNIYMVHFKNNWFETWSHCVGVFPKNEEEYLEMFSSILVQLKDSLLIVYDYVSNQLNQMFVSFFNQGDVIYVSSKKCGYDLEGLDYLIAYKLFDFYYEKEASSEREQVYRLIKLVNGNPSLMRLMAVVANHFVHEGYRVPIEHLNQELKLSHPKYYLNQNKHEFDPIIHNLLKVFDFSEEEKEFVRVFYFTHDLKVKKDTFIHGGIHSDVIEKFIDYQFVSNIDNTIILNKLIRKELYDKALGKHVFLSRNFVDILKNCANANLRYSFILKVDPYDPLLSEALEAVDLNLAYRVECSLLESCIQVLKEREFKHSIDISFLENIYLEKKLDIDSLTEYFKEAYKNHTLDKVRNELMREE